MRPSELTLAEAKSKYQLLEKEWFELIDEARMIEDDMDILEEVIQEKESQGEQ